MNFKNLFLLLGLALFTQKAEPHGMDKPGPHGGYIRMPGAFHTELVPVSENEWKIYLLDESFKKPTVKNSSLSGVLQVGQESIPIDCAEDATFFICSVTNGIPKDVRSRLRFEAKRNGGSKGIAIYDLPLTFR